MPNEIALINDPRHRGTGGADGGTPRRTHALRQQLLDDLPEAFAPDDVEGLDAQRIERPEARLDEPQQRTPAEPGEADEDREDDDGRDAGQDVGDPRRRRVEPQRHDDRREPQRDAGQAR